MLRPVEPHEPVVDRLAGRLRGVHPVPAHRDLMALAGLGCIVAAIALWQPLLGLGALGLALIGLAFLTAPAAEEKPNGS